MIRYESFHRDMTAISGHDGWEHAYDTSGAEPTPVPSTDHGGRVLGPPNPTDVYSSFIARPMSEAVQSGVYEVYYYSTEGEVFFVLKRQMVGGVHKALIVNVGGYYTLQKLSGWGAAGKTEIYNQFPTYAIFTTLAGHTYDLFRARVTLSAPSGGSFTVTVEKWGREQSTGTWYQFQKGDGTGTAHVRTISDSDLQGPGSFAVGASRTSTQAPLLRVQWEDGTTDPGYTDRDTTGEEWCWGAADWAPVNTTEKATYQYKAMASFSIDVPSGISKVGINVRHLHTKVPGVNAKTCTRFHLAFWKKGSAYSTRIWRSVKAGVDLIEIPVSAGEQTWYMKLVDRTNDQNEAVAGNGGSSYTHEKYDFSDSNAWLYILGLRLYGATAPVPNIRATGDTQWRYQLQMLHSLDTSRQSDSGGAADILSVEELYQSKYDADSIALGWFPTCIGAGGMGYNNGPAKFLDAPGTSRSDMPPLTALYTLTKSSVTRYTNLNSGTSFSPSIARFNAGTRVWLNGVEGDDILTALSSVCTNDSDLQGYNQTTSVDNEFANLKAIVDATYIGTDKVNGKFLLVIPPCYYGHAVQKRMATNANNFAGAGYTGTRCPITTPSADPNCYNATGGYAANGGVTHPSKARHAVIYSTNVASYLADLPSLPKAPDTGSLSQSLVYIRPGQSGSITVTLSHSTLASVAKAHVGARSLNTAVCTIQSASKLQRLPASGTMQVTVSIDVPGGAVSGSSTTVKVQSGSYTGTLTVIAGVAPAGKAYASGYRYGYGALLS